MRRYECKTKCDFCKEDEYMSKTYSNGIFEVCEDCMKEFNIKISTLCKYTGYTIEELADLIGFQKQT